MSFGASQGFLGRRDALESPLPLHPHLPGRGSPPGDRVSIISYLSLHPIHIQIHPLNFLVDFGKEYTGWKMFSFLSPLAAYGTTYEIIFYWICKTAVLITLPEDFPGGAVAKTPHSQPREPRFDPSPGTRELEQRLKIPCVTTKTLFGTAK